MRPGGAHSIAGVAICLAAAGWLLDTYQFLPLVQVRLYQLALVGLLLAAGASLLRTRRIRTPFELTWPLAFLTISSAVAADGRAGLEVLLTALVFLATVQMLHGPRILMSATGLIAAAGTVAALAVLFAPWLGWFPAVTHPPSGLELPHTGSLHFGFQGLLAGTACAAVLWRHEGAHQGLRAAAAMAGLMQLLALIALVAPLAGNLDALSPRLAPHPALLVPYLTGLYLLARLAAKRWVAPHHAAACRMPFVLAVLLWAVIWAWWPAWPRPAQGFFLGLVAASCLRPREQAMPRSAPWIALAAALLLAAWNAPQVLLSNEHDPRNYHAQAVTELGKSPDALQRRLDYLAGQFPGEARLHWWRARVLLAHEQPEAASDAFVRSLRAGGRQVLPPPSVQDRDLFLRALRDHVSAQPANARGLAYERALVASGNEGQALAILAHRADNASASPGSLEARPLAEALAFLLGAEAVPEALEAWPPGRLLAALEVLGAEPGRRPPGMNPELLPVVLVSRAGQERLELGVFGAAGAATREMIPADGEYAPESVTLPQWFLDEEPADTLHARLEAQTPLATVLVGEDAQLAVEPVASSALPAEPVYVLMVLLK